MPRLESNVLNNNERVTGNRRISVTVRRKGKPVSDESSTEPFVSPNISKLEKDVLEINALQNSSVHNNSSSIELETQQNTSKDNNSSSIFGIIRDLRGIPVRDAVAQLKAFRNGCYTVLGEVHSNHKGEYFFTSLPLGSYSLTIYKDGFINYESTNINITGKESIGLNLCLQEDFRNHLGSIHGIIRDESTNLPLENILVALYSVINNTELLISSTFSNNEGQYAFSLIPPGNYIIKAAAYRKEEA